MILPPTALAATALPRRANLPRSLRLSIHLAGQCLVLVGLSYAGTALVQITNLPLPGNLVGMLLLLALLRLGVVQLEHVEDAARLVLQHFNLFFVPFAVGLMGWGGLLGTDAIGLGLSLVGSAVVGLVVAGLLSQRLAQRGGGSDAR